MKNITLDNVTETVVASLGKHKPIDARQRTIMTSLIKHAHAFCKEVNLSHAEFIEGCMYLMRAGSMCDDKRQEFILLGDIIGVEVLVDMLTNPVRGEESVSTVLGPFYRENSPVLPKGASIVQKHFENEQSVVEGYVRNVDGTPIANATIDIWEDAPNGLYEQQDPDQPDCNLRGRFETDASGHYAFRAIRPMPYPIPYDGSAGELLDFYKDFQIECPAGARSRGAQKEGCQPSHRPFARRPDHKNPYDCRCAGKPARVHSDRRPSPRTLPRLKR
jgi:catechol 1,2-dioxygenase